LGKRLRCCGIESFYCYHINPNPYYEGATETRDPAIAATVHPVKYLFVDNTTYRNRNHILVTDNWYTSMENMEQVLLSGNHYLGTVRVNKKGLPPKEFHFPRTGRNKRQRGEMIQMKTTLLNGTNIYFIAWHDNKPVHMISSIPAVKTLCTRVVRNPDGSWDPNRKIPRPSNVAIYNCGMGGTDAIDQRVSYYRPNVKCTSAWYQRTFIHIIVLCCINAYIIYYLYLNLDRKEYTYLDFLRQLISELADDELEKKRHNTNAN
jgi:hypothetical protein